MADGRGSDRLGGNAEQRRLAEPFEGRVQPWRRWGPYISERAWGTVREDYSPDGEAWDHFPHELARSKAYRWGEDGIAGLCDRYQKLCTSLALWNGRDPILKERMFGLGHHEGNHGEDAKELWHYLDATPTHSYGRMLYRYPQAEFPYLELVEENRRRGGHGPEYELVDTGIFDDGRYWDVEVEHAKAAPEDLCIRITAVNRGAEPASLHLLQQLWFRNTWSWGHPRGLPPVITAADAPAGCIAVCADDSAASPLPGLRFDYRVGRRHLYGPSPGALLFTDNETNIERVYGCPSHSRFTKDAFHRFIFDCEDCCNPEETGTKAALHYV
ncbi:MAG TPA: glucosidase, partial [Candidatus Limnocylindria bacterium]|nr:glucosidase [Candidatus Limnocylindria bacterium]